MNMKRLRTIEKDFVLKPNPYVSEEQSNQVLWKLAVGEVMALSAFFCFTMTFLKIKPSLTASTTFKNFTYLQGVSSLGGLFYHFHELNELGKIIPESELNAKMKTYE
jgi:hypothetical protein